MERMPIISNKFNRIGFFRRRINNFLRPKIIYFPAKNLLMNCFSLDKFNYFKASFNNRIFWQNFSSFNKEKMVKLNN